MSTQTDYVKRTIPYVSLAVEPNGRNLHVEEVVSNLYIKVHEDSISAAIVIVEAAGKIGIELEQVVLLDSKFVQVDDEQTG